MNCCISCLSEVLLLLLLLWRCTKMVDRKLMKWSKGFSFRFFFFLILLPTSFQFFLFTFRLKKNTSREPRPTCRVHRCGRFDEVRKWSESGYVASSSLFSHSIQSFTVSSSFSFFPSLLTHTHPVYVCMCVCVSVCLSDEPPKSVFQESTKTKATKSWYIKSSVCQCVLVLLACWLKGEGTKKGENIFIY